MFIKWLILFFKRGLYLLCLYPKLVYYTIRKDKIPYEKRYNFVMKIVRSVATGFKINYEVEGLDLIPEGNNLVFCPNHQCVLDPCFVTLFNKPIFAISKLESSHYFYFKNINALIDSLYIDRNDIRQAFTTLKKASEQLRDNNTNMLIFLEGKVTLDEDKKMNEFKPGGLKPAYKNQSTIVPVALDGFYKCIHSKYNRHGYTCKVRFLKPIPYSEYKDIRTVDLAVSLQEEVQRNVSELRSKL